MSSDSRNKKSSARSANVIPVAPRIHLVAIGNEILNGEIRESNLAWLIKFFTRKGGYVVCADVIPDDFDAVRRELRQAQDAGVDLIVTTGGLGPTDDDATMAAIAAYLEQPLKLNKEALGYVKERIDSLAKYRPGLPRRLTKERKSMAIFPDGGIPLRNPTGVAPGMMYLIEDMTLVVLPGVPAEMKGIVRQTLKDFWKDFFEGVCYVRRNIALKGIPEAELAPYIRRAQKSDPGIYIKSRLRITGRRQEKTFEVGPKKLPWQIILHFSVIECTRSDGYKRVDRMIDALVSDLKENYAYPLHINLTPGRV
jgi:nicotinamide-nucleotide amidase